MPSTSSAGCEDAHSLTSRKTILVVEDDRNLLDGVRNILELEGFHVLVAGDGLEALDVLRRQAIPPDLILSDIMMPHMDGIELLEAVRRESRWLSIPVIYLTARGQRDDILRAKQMGVDDYIIKPYDPLELVLAVRSKLERYGSIRATHADEMAELKRSILTILNHEFRTPLTFVVAYADMLNNPDGVLEQTELVEFLHGVWNGADRLRRLIENFILLVELMTGDARQTFAWRSHPITDVGPFIQTACAEGSPSRPCEVDIAPDIPEFIGDEEYLKRALLHLIDNAAKFSEPDTPIVVRAWSQDASVLFSVEDQGRGIPPEEIDRVCAPFYQINRSVYEDQGSGSGLAIARAIAEMHGGRLHIESETGFGTRVTLAIPVCPA